MEFAIPTGPREAVWLLASVDAERGPPLEVQTQAVEVLARSPLEDHWNRGLLAGLRSPHPEIVNQVVSAIVSRLEHAASVEAQGQLLEAVLDACFLNLSCRVIRIGLDADTAGAAEARRSISREHNSARLIQTLAQWLQARPREFEHIRSHLLARVGSIGHMPGTGEMAGRLVEFQSGVAAGGDSPAHAVKALITVRRSALFTDPTVTEPALLPYLQQDEKLDIAELSISILQQYSMLLTLQTKERARQAMLVALSNLVRWLDHLPQDAASRCQHLQEVVNKARRGDPWESLNPIVRLHLEVHHELLPGPSEKGDLLRILRERYDTPEAEDILEQACKVLARLPLVRLRSEEIEQFILAIGKRSRGPRAWRALLEFVGSIITGIEELVLSGTAIEERDARRLRILKETLSHDRRLRRLLEQLATDPTLEISASPETEGIVRETAWRILLGCLPPDLGRLIGRGLTDEGGRFFRATVEVAAATHQRLLWDYVLPNWDALIEATPEPATQRERLLVLIEAFRRTLNFTAVQDGGVRAGRFVGLVFDHADARIRQLAERALIEGGYRAEVERERQRRDLQALTVSFEAGSARLVELDSRLTGQTIDASALRVEQAAPSLAVQEGLQERNLLVTGGWVSTATFQLDMKELRLRLAAAMHRVAEAEHELALLRKAMADAAKEEQLHLDAIGVVVQQQKQQERDQRQLEAELESVESELARLEVSVKRMESEREWLRSNPPRAPGDQGSAAANEAAKSEFEQELEDRRERIEELKREISDASSQVKVLGRTQRSLQGRIAAIDKTLRALQGQIDILRKRTAELQRLREDLGQRLGWQQTTIEAIRKEIGLITDAIERARARAQREREQLASELARTSADIESAQARLRNLRSRLEAAHRGLVETRRQIDDQRTDCQRLAQAITAGRSHYDRVGAEADRDSAEAERRGASMMSNYVVQLLEAHESFVHYVEGMSRAMEQAPVPTRPTARATQRRRSRTTQTGGDSK